MVRRRKLPGDTEEDSPRFLSADWERRIMNLIITGVILYIGSVAQKIDIRVEVLSVRFNESLTKLDNTIKKSETTRDIAIKNKYCIAEHEKRITKLEE